MNASLLLRFALVGGVCVLAGASTVAVAQPPSPAASPAAATAAKGVKEREGPFTLVNKTGWDIAELHVTPAEEDAWTGNLLKHKLAANGGTVKVSVICDETDVKLVDTHGHTCVNESMYPCGRNSTWTITPEQLAGCKNFGQ